MILGIDILLLEAILETVAGNMLDTTRDCIGIIETGNSRHDYRHHIETDINGNGFKGCRCPTLQIKCLDFGTVIEGIGTLLHDQIADRFHFVPTIQVIPFLDADLEAGAVNVADADHRRIAAVQADRSGYDHRVGKGFFEGDAFPIVIDLDLAECHQLFDGLGIRIGYVQLVGDQQLVEPGAVRTLIDGEGMDSGGQSELSWACAIVRIGGISDCH